MEQQPSDVCDLMPCDLEWSHLKYDSWTFWSIKHNDELDYQQSIKSINSFSVVSMIPTEKWKIQSVMEKMSTSNSSLFQFWAPIKVNGSTFLSTADQPFTFYKGIDKSLSSYRKLCLDTLIPIDNEIPFGPPARVFSRLLPEYNPDVSSYSSAEFPLLQTAIPLDSYYAFPVFNIHDQQCLGVFEIVSTLSYLNGLNVMKDLDFESVGFYIPYSINKLFEPPKGLNFKSLGYIAFLNQGTNRGTVNVDVAHDDHIEYTTEIMQLDSHFEQPNLETNSAGNATTNNEIIHSHKKNAIQRIEKDHGITRKILEQHYGMTLEDAAKDLHVSRATLKRICRENGIARWPHHKTRKVNVHVSQGVSFQGAEPYVGDQQCSALPQEKGTEYLGNKRSPATGVSRDGVMTLKVTYRGDIIKFQLSLSSTKIELEGEVEKRFKISLKRFSIKYEDEDDDWILITSDSDLRDGMNSLRLLGRNTMRLEVNPEADT